MSIHPRSENPREYRDNVRKSWQVIAELLAMAGGECFIAHLEPNPGVGYDCLSLVVRGSEGGLRTYVMLNRNGSTARAGDNYPDTWNKVDQLGPKKVAEELAAMSGLPTGGPRHARTVRMEQVARQVVAWINAHRDEDFYVGPPHWPGAPSDLLPVPRSTTPEDWPGWDVQPDLTFAINNKETERINMTEEMNNNRRNPDEWVAVSIARCGELKAAVGDQSHPCHKIVNLQGDNGDRHIPEAWFGNLGNANVVFVSSNPSIDRNEGPTGENYPRAHWSDQDIAVWMTRRTDNSLDAAPVTFNNPGYRDFMWRCVDGEYRGAGKSGKSSQPTWNKTHQRAVELLGPTADPSRNYALIEIVHCKSENAAGVPEAMSTCTQKWLTPVMQTPKDARIVILNGSHVRNWARGYFGLSGDFGARVRSGGIDVALQSTFVSDKITGKSQVFCFMPHVTASEPGGNKFDTRYGTTATQTLGRIARGEIPIPGSTADLHRLLRDS